MNDYSEHLISQAGGDGDVLGEIEARYETSQAALSHGSSSNVRMLHRLSESANDVPYLLALVREQAAKLGAVRTLCDAADRYGDYHVIQSTTIRTILEATK